MNLQGAELRVTCTKAEDVAISAYTGIVSYLQRYGVTVMHLNISHTLLHAWRFEFG